MTTSESSTTCEEWTVVAIGVESSTRPSSRKNPCSRSAKPAPLPVRPPRRVTATQPTTQKSSLGMSSKPTGSPCSMNPCAVADILCRRPWHAPFEGGSHHFPHAVQRDALPLSDLGEGNAAVDEPNDPRLPLGFFRSRRPSRLGRSVATDGGRRRGFGGFGQWESSFDFVSQEYEYHIFR